jgi:uncharacterized protein
MRLRTAFAAVFCLLGINRPLGAQAAPPYEVIRAEHDLMIPVRDGLKMATDVYRPARNGVPVEGRFPVLLNRTPYDKGSLAAQAETFAKAGYVVAVQDLRGRYVSEGKFLKVQPADATDGYDTIEWLAKQPWSNGQGWHVGAVVRRARAGRCGAA